MERVRDVYLWSNGMLVVFDEAGEQVTELQGRANRDMGGRPLLAALVADAPEGCRFYMGQWQLGELGHQRGGVVEVHRSPLAILAGMLRAEREETHDG